MKRIVYFVMIALGFSLLMGTGTSCKKEVFDPNVYDTLIKIQSPVDSVDPTHTWTLTKTANVIVEANANIGTRQVQILDDNPVSSPSARIIAKRELAEGERAGLNISYPSNLSTLYAACVDEAGAYTVTNFSPSQSEVNFSSPLAKQQKLNYTPDLQYYAFCYEQEYPEPGDYDYNDVVMHIALEPVSPKITYIHVKLAAVGASVQLAGAIRLPELGFEEIDSVWTVDGQSFNKGITEQYLIVQKDLSLLLRGKNNEAVLNIFADAHWATGDDMNADFGVFKRKRYNVTKVSGTDAQLMVPREVVFAIRTTTENRSQTLTLDNIDPFIIKQYSGANMEVHTYNYRSVTALYDYRYIDVAHLPWALVVPSSTFNHPLHGINMGFRMRDNTGLGIMFGAYATTGHAFGEWAMSKTKSTDWYFYPDKSNVFEW